MQFHVPPGWPLDDDFEPSPSWRPDPSWPPAPPGWQFWSDPVQAHTSGRESEAPWSAAAVEPGYLRSKPIAIASVGGLVAAVAVAVGVYQVNTKGPLNAPAPAPSSELADSHSAVPSAANTPSVNPVAAPSMTDLRQWQTFGGIDAQFADGGDSVLLDTHDTTNTWTTKWSGLIAQGPARCAVRLHARVRDHSHAAGIPGGYGIGLANAEAIDSADPRLQGWAVQYDFGQSGFRLATYPDDGDVGLVAATPDHEWHDVDLAVEASGEITEEMDGVRVMQAQRPSGCGQPVIRVWAGAAEFADVVVS